MKSNIIIQTIRNIREILPKKYQLQALQTYVLIFINSIFDLMGLAAILPFVALVLQPDFLEKYPIVQQAYTALGFTDTRYFILAIAGSIFVGIVLKNIFGIWVNKRQGEFAFSIYKYLTQKMLKVKMQKGYLYFATTNSNRVVNQIIGVPRNFGQQLLLPLLTLLNEVTVLSMVLIGLIAYDPKIILVLAFIVAPFFLLFYRLTRQKIDFIGTRLNELNPITSKPIFEMIFGYVDTQITGTEKLFTKKYKMAVDEVSELSVTQSVLNNTPTRVVEVAMILAVLLMMLYGIFVIENTEGVLTMLGIFGLAAYRTIPTINRMMLGIMQIKGQQYTFPILKEIQDLVLTEEKETKKTLQFQTQIELKNISFQFPDGEEHVLKNVSLEVKKGETLGLIGKSGSGKTTLINILLRFIQQDQGEILVDSIPLGIEERKAWQSRIGYVRQDVFLIDGTLAENIAFGQSKEEINQERLLSVIEKASLSDLLPHLKNGVDTLIGERGAQLSGGQRQRVGIARALYYGAEILVFDEATSALDTQTETEITEAIRALSDQELTMFIIAHRTSTLKYCDKIVELQYGEVMRECVFEEI